MQHFTWPQPCRPPPHQPGFIKQTGPYIARARAAQGRLIRRGGSSVTLGPALGGRGRCCHQSPAEHPPPTLPELQPSGYPNRIQVPIPAPLSPQLLLWDPGKCLSVPFCQMGLPLPLRAVPYPEKLAHLIVETVGLCTCFTWCPSFLFLLSKPQFTHQQKDAVSQYLLALQSGRVDFFFKGRESVLSPYIPPRNKKIDQGL